MPIPPPMNSQSFFCFSVAFRSRENHINGTDIVRPSANTTVSSSREQETSTASASLLVTKVGIPSLQEQISVLVYKAANDRQLVATKSEDRCQVDRIEREFRIAA